MTVAAEPATDWKDIPGEEAFTDEERVRELYRNRAYSHNKPKPSQKPVYTLGGVTIATAGNLVAVTAHQGSGKSSFVAAALAAPMVNATGPKFPDVDCLGLISRNPEGHALIHIDTEQAAQDYDLLIRHKAISRARLSEPPTWLMSTWLTGCSPAEIIAVLIAMLEDGTTDSGGIHSVWLDGIADAVNTPNDEAEANTVVRSLHTLAIKYSCPIFSILHLNPGSTFKSRGHLGSQLERKAETVLQLKKAIEEGKEVTTVLATKTRHKPILQHLAPRFAWNQDAAMHMSVETQQEVRKLSKERHSLELARAVWADDHEAALAYNEVVTRLVDLSRREGLGRGGDAFSQRTAQGRVKTMVECGAIQKLADNKHYGLGESAKRDLRC